MDILQFTRKPDFQRRPETTSRNGSTATIFPGFDGVRAFAALGVVLLHSCVPYLRHPMPGLVWPVRDSSSDIADCLFWAIELFIMPVFLVLAGFLAWQTLSRKSPAELVRSRAKRLLRPLAFGMLVILPLDLYVWILGWVVEGLVPIVKLKSLKIDGPLGDNLWGLSHLWFLQYLFLYVALLAGWSCARKRVAFLRQWRPNLSIVGASLVVIAVFTLTYRPQVVWGFQHAFHPVPSKWIYSCSFFLGGVLIACRDPQLNWLRQFPGRLIAPAIMFSIAAVMLGRWHLAGGESRTASVLLASVTVIAAWTMTLSAIGSAARIRSVPQTIKYLAAASFWIYLVHHPLLGLVHLDLKLALPNSNGFLLSPIVRVGLAFAITTSVCLIGYESFVRRSRLGDWLGFSWSTVSCASGSGTQRDRDNSTDAGGTGAANKPTHPPITTTSDRRAA